MAEPIVINFVSSTKEISQQMLDDCYFYEMGDKTFSLFSAANAPLKHHLTHGKDFDFDLGPFNFSVSKFFIASTGGPDGKGHANGHWVANVLGVISLQPLRTGDADDEGTFQAQAGGHGQEVPERKTAAGASY